MNQKILKQNSQIQPEIINCLDLIMVNNFAIPPSESQWEVFFLLKHLSAVWVFNLTFANARQTWLKLYNLVNTCSKEN